MWQAAHELFLCFETALRTKLLPLNRTDLRANFENMGDLGVRRDLRQAGDTKGKVQSQKKKSQANTGDFQNLEVH